MSRIPAASGTRQKVSVAQTQTPSQNKADSAPPSSIFSL